MRGGRVRARIFAFLAGHPSLSRILFNRIFQSERGPHRINAFLQEAVRGVSPGRALDVTMGQGRNAVFLASLGWDVTGFDLSDRAIARALELGSRSGVTLRTVRSTAAAFDYGVDQWDLLLLCYAWAPISDPAFVQRLKQSLRAGGRIVFEHYLHTGPESPPKEAGAPDPGDLAQSFAGFEMLHYQESAGRPDWEPPVRPKEARDLVRMIARKPFTSIPVAEVDPL